MTIKSIDADYNPRFLRFIRIISLLLILLGVENLSAQVKKHPAFSFQNVSVSGINDAVTGLGMFPDGRMAAVTWVGGGMDKPDYTENPAFERDFYGSVYIIENGSATEIYNHLIDAMGVLVHEGDVYVTDQNRLIKFTESNGSWTEETFLDIPSGDGYFEYSFGPLAPGDGYFYIGNSNHTDPPVGYMIEQVVPDRGTIIRVPVEGGDYEVYAKGIRMPNGMGLGPNNNVVVTENQGVWRPASVINYIEEGKHYGYTHSVAQQASIEFTPSTIQLPYQIITSSPSQLVRLDSGPFKDQIIFGDWPAAGLYRAHLDPIMDNNGEMTYQGSCFYLTSGNSQSALRLIKDEGTNDIYIANIAAYGRGGFQKLTYDPEASFFEMRAIRARKGGLEIEFTQPVGSGADNAGNYSLEDWDYDYSVYENTRLYYYPDITPSNLSVTNVNVSDDKTRVFLEVDGMTERKVIHVSLGSLTSESGTSLLYDEGWYTLNYLSEVDFSLVPIAEAKKEIPSDLFINQLLGKIAFEWTSEYSSLFIYNLNGSVEESFDVSGKKRFQISRTQGYKGLYLVKLLGESNSTIRKLAF